MNAASYPWPALARRAVIRGECLQHWAASRLTQFDPSIISPRNRRARLQRVFVFWPGKGDSNIRAGPMKIKNSLKALKARHRECRLVRRKGRVYIINKTDPRYKARQG